MNKQRVTRDIVGTVHKLMILVWDSICVHGVLWDTDTSIMCQVEIMLKARPMPFGVEDEDGDGGDGRDELLER